MNFKLHPHPATPVTFIETSTQGKFLSYPDMLARIRDESVIDEALAMLQIGHKKGDHPRVCMRQALASFIIACSGDAPMPPLP